MLDTIRVDPESNGRGEERAMREELVKGLAALRIEKTRIEGDYTERKLMGYLAHEEFLPALRFAPGRLIW